MSYSSSLSSMMEDGDSSIYSNTDATICNTADLCSSWGLSLISDPNMPDSSSSMCIGDDLIVSGASSRPFSYIHNIMQTQNQKMEVEKRLDEQLEVKRRLDEQLEVKWLLDEQLEVKRRLDEQLEVKRRLDEQLEVKRLLDEQLEVKRRLDEQLEQLEVNKRLDEQLEVKRRLDEQLEVRRRLDEQLEVQRQLHLRIETQGKYMKKIIQEQQRLAHVLSYVPSSNGPESETRAHPATLWSPFQLLESSLIPLYLKPPKNQLNLTLSLGIEDQKVSGSNM